MHTAYATAGGQGQQHPSTRPFEFWRLVSDSDLDFPGLTGAWRKECGTADQSNARASWIVSTTGERLSRLACVTQTLWAQPAHYQSRRMVNEAVA